MKSLTIKKDNYTGEETIIKFNEEGDLIVNGSKYKIKETPMEENESNNNFKYYEITSKDHNWKPIFNGLSINGIFTCSVHGAERSAKDRNKHIAVAQLICNIL